MKRRAALLPCLWLLLVAPAHGQVFGDQVPLADVLEIIILEGEIFAIDAAGGGQLSESLHLGEEVVWSGSQGRVGVVITNERVLFTAIGASSWREERWERTEERPARALLGDRVGVVVTNNRALGFASGSRRFSEYRFGPREDVLAQRVGSNVVVVVTSRKAVGLAPDGGFTETRLQLKEKLRDVKVRSNVVTVQTNRRLLIFRGPARSWSEQRLELRQSG